MSLQSNESVARLCEPLLQILRSGRHLRVVARPGWIAADRVEASTPVQVAWEASRHRELCGLIEEPVTLEDGCTVAAFGNTLVLRRPPDPLRRIEDLVQDGRISLLGGRLLSAAVGLGRNVLVAGPWAAGVELVAALLAEGGRPALVGSSGDASPPAWPLLDGGEQARIYGADRVGTWSLRGAQLASLLVEGSGVVAWTDARRLERALLRFEAGLDAGADAPLFVLAGIDLVVVLSDLCGPRVREIAEVALVEEGYRPRLLFSVGVPPVPTALVPVGAPSLIDELAAAGHGVLADELRHATAGRVIAAPISPPAQEAPGAQPAEPSRASRLAASHDPASRPITARRIDPALEDVPPPGWELDQLGDEALQPQDGGGSSATDAAMAATFGLAPPPPPPGMAPITPDTLPRASDGSSFADALDRARLRDDELREEEEG